MTLFLFAGLCCSKPDPYQQMAEEIARNHPGANAENIEQILREAYRTQPYTQQVAPNNAQTQENPEIVVTQEAQ